MRSCSASTDRRTGRGAEALLQLCQRDEAFCDDPAVGVEDHRDPQAVLGDEVIAGLDVEFLDVEVEPRLQRFEEAGGVLAEMAVGSTEKEDVHHGAQGLEWFLTIYTPERVTVSTQTPGCAGS